MQLIDPTTSGEPGGSDFARSLARRWSGRIPCALITHPS